MVSEENFVSRSLGSRSSDSNWVYHTDDPSDEYYIHPNENPALVLTSSLLTGSGNYHTWARSMRMSLISKNKFLFVNGAIKQPSDADPRFFAWEKCNNLVLSWLQRAIHPDVVQSVVWIDTALTREIWFVCLT
ncbi:hypothetical protein GQ457_18G021710 [Hibiscus cannabinus]